MAKKQTGTKGGRRKIGRWIRKPSNQRYQQRGYENKVKRILQSNGRTYLERWKEGEL